MFTSIVLLTLVGASATPQHKREVADRIAAVIEGQIITVAELEEKAGPYMAKLDEVKDPAARETQRIEIMRRVLDIEIGDRIVTAELEKSRDKLGVTDADVDRAIQEVQKMNRLNQEQLQAALYAQGITWSEYRKKLREQIERTRLIQFQVQGKVQLNEGDVNRRCLERQRTTTKDIEVCGAHILRMIPKGASDKEIEELRARMSKLQSELAAGADFSAYALKFSDDKGAPDGNLGCFGKGEMVEPFERAAFALKPGEISAVVRTEFGFHIIKVSDRRTPAPASCTDENLLNEIKNQLYQEEMERQMNLWLSDLRKKRFVDVRI